ncbi:ISXO2-like transposase domain protein [mine drainage metagenome]|uniref:ISXO2-like transposase domain protein n=1 Tax=mine drainage metagenome TaxID=410659 RepID=A0A1J5Q742_9ZZZZ
MHSTKLDLRIWIATMFLVITSSKGISSVVMARILGVSQKTAWKMGHAIREMMDQYGARSDVLSGTVEVDEAYVGGKPKYQPGKTKSKSGKGTSRPEMLVAVMRGGDARATVIQNSKGATIAPIMRGWIAPSSTLMTDGDPTYKSIGSSFAAHHSVVHKRQFAIKQTNAHINTAEAFTNQVKRAMVGVYHQVDRQHLQA